MQQPVYSPHPQHPSPRRRRGGFKRFVRGYLMLVGGLTTIVGFILLLVRLFVEIEKWMPNVPIV